MTKAITIEIQMVFPPTAEPSQIEALCSGLQRVIPDDFRILGRTCIPDERLKHGDVEVKCKITK